jgi:hypothetical protein
MLYIHMKPVTQSMPHFPVSVLLYIYVMVGGRLNEQAKMLEQNTANDELFSKETTTVHHEFKERMDIMQKMLQTHDRTIGNDCVRMASFSEVCTELNSMFVYSYYPV